MTWDDPVAGAPMLATMTPQQAVNRGLPRRLSATSPWSCSGRASAARCPTSFTKPNGQPYLSGTEWEFENARGASREVLVYRRTEKVLLDDEAPDFEQRT